MNLAAPVFTDPEAHLAMQTQSLYLVYATEV